MAENGNEDPCIVETVEYIFADPSGPDTETLSAIFKTWYDADSLANERARVSAALRQVASGSAAPDKLRRATLLLRTVVLRHELSKAQREVKGAGDTVLERDFPSLLQQCVNFTRIIPPWLDSVKQEGPPVSKEEMLEIAGMLSDEPGLEGADLAAILRDKQDSMSEDQRRTYEQWQKAERASKKVIYLAKGADKDIVTNVTWLKDSLEGCILEGQEGLQKVGGCAALYIVGHGNFGSGMGTHKEHLGAKKLVESLERDGLPKKLDDPLWVYLWGCWTGTSTRRAWGGFGQREPYARRFARALAARGFGTYFVVGFAGSVAPGRILQSYKTSGGNTEVREGSGVKRSDYVVYEVKSGNFNRVAGEDWTAKSHPTLQFWKDHDMTVERR